MIKTKLEELVRQIDEQVIKINQLIISTTDINQKIVLNVHISVLTTQLMIVEIMNDLTILKGI